MLPTHRAFHIGIASALLCAIPAPSFARVFVGVGIGFGSGVGVAVNVAPPALPVYVQPPCPVPGLLWTPGYWGWGQGGYYWVPGTWVAPPTVGVLWTPGYWGWGGNAYAWNPGYWGPHVGFYGGVNYGFGYFGTGYVGGGWFGNGFRYNTAVTNVNTTIVRNVYVNRTVINNYYGGAPQVSYNGGPGGISARPTAAQRAAIGERRFGLEPAQRRHVELAAQNRNFLATVNRGHPAQAAVARPFTASHRPAAFAPLQAADRPAAQRPNAALTAVRSSPTAFAHRAGQEAAPTSLQASRPQAHAAASSEWNRFATQRGLATRTQAPGEGYGGRVDAATPLSERPMRPSYAQPAEQNGVVRAPYQARDTQHAYRSDSEHPAYQAHADYAPRANAAGSIHPGYQAHGVHPTYAANDVRPAYRPYAHSVNRPAYAPTYRSSGHASHEPAYAHRGYQAGNSKPAHEQGPRERPGARYQ